MPISLSKFFKLFLVTVYFLYIPHQGLAERPPEFWTNLVQCLIDSEAGLGYTGESQLSQEELARYRVVNQSHMQVYAINFMAEHSKYQGEYRIIVGPLSPPDLPRPLWKKHPYKVPGRDLSLWLRRVTSGQGEQIEALARDQKGDLGFEARFLVPREEFSADRVIDRLNFLVENAARRNLWGDGELISAKAPPSMKSNESDFIGTWIGPMENSRGDKVVQSTLVIEAGPGSSLQGTWHQGWKFSNAQLKGNTLTWKHTKLMGGCRDYTNKFVSDDGQSGLLSYKAFDRCRKPPEYQGTAELRKEK